jgi:predicted nucleotide-binding protein (sugar kinase/HSP70/actin superfamily)
MFERLGYECVSLPGSTRSNYELAKQYSRGTECCPAIAVLGSILDHVTKSGEREFNVAMMTGYGPCRFGQYVHFYHSVLRQFGAKVNYINVKRGVALDDSVSRKFKTDVYKGIVAVDVLKKFLHGSTDQVFKHYENILYEAIRKDDPMEPVIAEASEAFKRIRVDMSQKKKLVGIIGEIFVRQEEFINEGLIDEIERNGGEVWLMPLSGWFLEGACRDLIDTINTAITDIPMVVKRGLSLYTLDRIEKKMMKAAGPELQERHEPGIREIWSAGSKYLSRNLPLEDLPNIGRARIFAGKDKVDLIVNAKPFSCMPGNIVEAVLKEVEDEYNVPVINLSYEGGEGTNRPVRNILENLQTKAVMSGKENDEGL